MPLYVVHTSCEEGPRSHPPCACRQGKRVWGEPLIQHLTLDESEYFNKDWDHAARRVMSPPFRNKQHQDSLWAGLAAGTLQVVATDHCAFTTEQKRYGVGDFSKIPNGTGGLEDRLPMLWTYGVATGRITMNEFVAVTSTNMRQDHEPLPRKRGAVLVGAGRRFGGVGPGKIQNHHGRATQESRPSTTTSSKVKRSKASPPLHPHPWAGCGRGRHAENRKRGMASSSSARRVNPVNKALSTWKELTAPRRVERTGIPASGV